MYVLYIHTYVYVRPHVRTLFRRRVYGSELEGRRLRNGRGDDAGN